MNPDFDLKISRRLFSGALTACRITMLWLMTSSGAVFAQQIFSDITKQSGVGFVHFNGMSGELYFPEMMGAGAALLDYDNDGDLDIYLVQGNMLGPGKKLSQATFRPADEAMLYDRLYRNDGPDENTGKVHFTDVTKQSGIRSNGYGMGVAVGDIDGDGYADLYVLNLTDNQLWRNNGDGTFKNMTAIAGVTENRWSVSASFVDIDRDGDDDLYVGNFLIYDINNPTQCRFSKLVLDYCGPSMFQGNADALFLNDGTGKFTDISKDSGIGQARGGALGVITADFNGDNWVDIYVANDSTPNLLWLNQKDNTFVDDALLAGAAVNKDGMAEASMGIDAADHDGDGDIDLFMTHLTRETNTLYVNDGNGWFEDDSNLSGLGNPSFAFTGFGTAWRDFDNDGLLDIFIANGAVQKIEAQILAKDPHPLHQSNQLFLNNGEGAYRDVSDQQGKQFLVSEVSRGAAFGDIDNDGDVDIVLTNNAGPARLLENIQSSKHDWIGIQPVSADGKREIAGARVNLQVSEQAARWNRSRRDGSYASSNDPRILFALPGGSKNLTISIHWPDGNIDRWSDLSLNQYHALRKGAGSR